MFKRVSDSFWAYVSPVKDNKPDTANETPQTAPANIKAASTKTRKGSLDQIVRQSRSMSPIARMHSWHLGPSSSGIGMKRKGIFGEIQDQAQKRGKMAYGLDDSDDAMESGEESMNDYDEEMDTDPRYNNFYVGEEPAALDEDSEDVGYGAEGEDYDIPDADALAEDMSNIRMRMSPDDYDDSDAGEENSVGYVESEDADAEDSEEDDDEDEPEDTTLVVSEEEYAREHSRSKKISVPAELSNRGVSSEELAAAGWSEEHIFLVQRIAMRGFEPLLPQYYFMDFRYLPDALFVQDDDKERAFISGIKGPTFHGIKALEKLFTLGGYVRDMTQFRCNTTPEMQFKRHLQDFIKWTDRDSGLDTKTTIPPLTLVVQNSDTPISVLQETARRKMAKLHSRYYAAFSAHQTIEDSSPSSTSTSTKLHRPIPQIYALMASWTVIALVAYRPDLEEDQQAKVVSHHNFDDKDYDVWNSLALAIVVCHVRDVQVKIAEETGLGVRQPGVQEEVDDPDL
ncbi:hypothetical protein D0864_10756 [Hortaea werneckii]|uniref:Uncharacterized protein n=1 Tax=Hortaea werneckii TaxID=91943 RepID=A0A3M7E368_HORWE|nr:hypothetical protein D0864_10756 [Hortaea werneckii]